MIPPAVLSSVLILGAQLDLGSAAAATDLQQHPQSEVMPPYSGHTYGYQKGSAPIDLGLGNLVGYAEYSLNSRKVHLRWRVKLGPGNEEFVVKQTEPVSFFPTEVCGLGPDRMAVAGGTVRGRTIIEIWEFKDIPAPVASFDDAGQVVEPDIQVPVISRTVVFNELEVGMQYVIHMSELIGRPDHLLLQFHDSRDLYELDIATGLATRVASPNDPVTGEELHVPGLDNDFRTAFHAVTLPTRGNVYWFMDPSGSCAEVLIIRDEDSDGTLDGAETWSPESGSSVWMDYTLVTHQAR